MNLMVLDLMAEG